MITSFRVAYKIGFSSSLNEGSWSAYNELSKWSFGEKDHMLKRAFCRGYKEGSAILLEVRREMVTGARNSDRA